MTTSSSKQAGISLIEVLIAVVILSFGMLALASLQGQLLRAGAETKARAAATAFAQAQIEAMRSFRTLVSSTVCSSDNPYCDYKSIATGAFGGTADYEVAGVKYYGCTQVRRFRMNPATGLLVGQTKQPTAPTISASGNITCVDAEADPNVGSSVSATVPEFKEVSASVGWVDERGEAKFVQLTDTIAAISPDDALELAKAPPEPVPGPVFEIDKSALANGVVPIHTGENRTSASTNPTPTQYVDSLSSLTSFDVMSFVATENPDVLKITRNVPMNAVSCVCSTGATASDSIPSFEPTVWNGKHLAYDPPARRPNGLPIGTYVGSNSNAGITSICTVCCRDHNDSNKKLNSDVDPDLRVDPYRTLLVDGSHPHFGFKKQGQGYVIKDGLLPVGADTNNEYVEACKVIEVGGRLRLGVDAYQNDLTIAAMDGVQSGFEQPDFVDRYSNFVRDYVTLAMNHVLDAGSTYPKAPTYLPPVDDSTRSAHGTILSPAPLSYAAYPDDRKLLSFGLYVDYLSKETKEAYKCAKAKDNSGSCQGYGVRDPLEFVPFFALNLASLGEWSTKPNEQIAMIAGATYDPQGRLATQGGLATWGAGSDDDPIPGMETINISNSGLTATVPIDDDDAADKSFVSDVIGFLKTSGTQVPPPRLLSVKIAASSTITLQKLGVSSPAGVTPCNYSPPDASSDCSVPSTSTDTTLRIANFTTEEKIKGSTVVHDRKVCLPNDPRIYGITTYNQGSIQEYVDLRITGMNTADHELVVEVQDAAAVCDQGKVSLTPAN